MRSYWTSSLIAPGVLVVSLIVGMVVYQGLADFRVSSFEERLQREAQFRAVRLQEQFEVRLTLVEVLLHELESGALAPGPTFAQRAQQLHERFLGIQALNLVDDSGLIIQVVPEATNQAALGKNVRSNPVARPAFVKAQESGSPKLTRPLTLFQGGKGFAGYFPVKGKALNVNAVFRIEDVVKTIIDDAFLRQHSVMLECNEEPVFENPLQEELHSAGVLATFRVRGQQWTLRLQPSSTLAEEEVQSQIILPLILLVCLILTLLSALIVRGLRRQAGLEERLQQARQMEALSTLAGGMAHDFNNLLTALTTILQLNRGEQPDEEDWREDVGTMLEACEQGARLTAQMMALSLRQETTSEPFLADEALKVAINLLDKSLPSTVRLQQSLNAPHVWLSGQAGALQQAVVNLARNASDAMPGGGPLKISSSVSADGGCFHLVIEDEGEGISQENLKKVFDPFFSTKGHSKGSGLGLSMVFHVVNALGGKIDVDSTAGKGTQVRIALPTIPMPAVALDHGSTSSDALNGVVILLADDDNTIRQSLKRHLESDGATVVATSSGNEALRYEGPFDVLLTDMRMANGSGAELVHSLWKRRPRLPVVVMSGFSDEDIPSSDLARVRFVAKPFQLGSVVNALAWVLRDDSSSS